MTSPSSKSATKVAYLLGAGATHAELMASGDENVTQGMFLKQNSLLLADVSKRVCERFKKNGTFPSRIQKLLSPSGLSNIELFISLLEANHDEEATAIGKKLRGALKVDIERRLRDRRNGFYLHRALLELHRIDDTESISGVISLNFDDVLDEAYGDVYRLTPDYGMTPTTTGSTGMPLLKLHGGFNLEYRGSPLPIITPGVRKNYLELPYSFIWGRALELLLDCDVLRVIGCSLSQNDLGVIDLLFKAHTVRREPFTIQLIDFDYGAVKTKEYFGFFPKLEPATEIETRLITDSDIRGATGANPFKIWLRAKIAKQLGVTRSRRTTHIKKVMA